MEIRLRFFLLLCYAVCIASSDGSKCLIGIAPQDESYYKGLSSGAINCKDGSKKFTKDQLNDDFCDCPDGSDEPGTSACPTGKFYCKNAGHSPLLVYPSRVNDGICDCCDGSDEYAGWINCTNTCWEAGKVARDKLKKKISTYQEGVTLRAKEVEEAKLAIAKEKLELSELKNEEKILKELVEQLKGRKEQIEKAEEKERLKREREEKERKEVEDAKLDGSKAEEKTEDQEETLKNDVHDKIGLLEDSPSVQDVVEGHEKNMDEVEHGDHSIKDVVPGDEVEQVAVDFSQEKDATENTEALSKEELGHVVASRWMGKKSKQETEEVDGGTDSNYDSHDGGQSGSHEEEYNGYNSEDDEHTDEDDDAEDEVEDFGEEDPDSSSSYKSESDDDSDFSDDTATSSPSWMEKMQQTMKSIFGAVNLFQTPVNISDADHIRKEYEESSAKLSKVQSRISSLAKKLKHDFGPEKEFYSYYGQCFESKQNKYTYKICPFKEATQVESYSTTRLGNWEKFEDSYRTMQFSSGDKCWNGPDRSIKVKLRCGLNNELTDVDEPSRCEYLAFLATPALCLEGKLKELQDKLETMNGEQPQGHDDEL